MTRITSDKKILFLALSKSQRDYFEVIARETGVNAKIIYVKECNSIALFSGVRTWMKQNQISMDDWLSFKLDKEQANNAMIGNRAIYRFLLSIPALRFFTAYKKQFEAFAPDAVVLLNGEHYKLKSAISLAETNNIPVIYFELGFLPNTLAVDGRGVNCNNSLPRDPQFYRDYKIMGAAPDRNLVVRPSVTPLGDEIELPENYIFIPFQVYDDTQVLVNSPWVKSMDALYEKLEACVESLPDNYYFVVKEHPTSKITYPHLYQKNTKIIFANANNTQQLIEKSKFVITINSSVGIESLLLNKPVITLGDACYNIEGLVGHADDVGQLKQYVSQQKAIPYDSSLVEHFIAYINEQYLVPQGLNNHDEKQYQRIAEVFHDIIVEGLRQ